MNCLSDITSNKYNLSKLFNLDKKYYEIIKIYDFFILSVMSFVKKKKENNKFYVFGSKAFELKMNQNKKNTYQYFYHSDLDILCNIDFYSNIVKLFKNYCNDNDITINNKSLESSHSSILEFNGISTCNKIKFNTLLNLIKNILGNESNYILDLLKKIKNFEFYLKNELGINFVYEIDFCVSGFKKKKNIKKIITHYSNNLMAHKTFLLTIDFDRKHLKVNLKNHKSFFLKKSSNKELFCKNSVNTLIWIYTTYLKIFSKNGLKNNLILIDNKKIKNKSYYYLINIIKKKFTWLLFNTKLCYKFLFLNELLEFPPTKNFYQILENLDIECKNNIYLKWLFLLRQIFGINLEKNQIKDIDEYKIIELLKKNILKIRIIINNRKKEITCPICLDRFTMYSPIHLCKKGHICHLNCIIQKKKEYLVSALKKFNNNSNTSLCNRNFKQCCICRIDNLNLKVNIENKKEYNVSVIKNSNISGILRYDNKNLLKNINNNLCKKCPIDLYIKNPKNLCNNLYIVKSFKKYLLSRFYYMCRIIKFKKI